MSGAGEPVVGLVDGAVPANTRRYTIVLADDAVVQLDELLVTRSPLPDGSEVAHYGIVVEGTGHLEGASYASDTARIMVDQTMPGATARRVEVQLLRTLPEMWVAPNPGAPVHRARGLDRDNALFLDQMDAPLPVGLDQAGQPVNVDFAFVNGAKGGHVNISGISGVATKTTYALFLLYQLLETSRGRELLGQHAANTRALVFNVKGEDLLHIDRPNAAFPTREGASDQWAALGVDAPGRFENVCLYAPRRPGREGSASPDVVSRSHRDVVTYGWTPREFVRRGLLRFCFSEADDARTQVGFLEARVRVQLARWAWPLAHSEGGIVLRQPPAGTGSNFERLVAERRDPQEAGVGTPVRNFGDLVDFLDQRIEEEHPEWVGRMAPGTAMAFIRRLHGQASRLGHLVTEGVEPVELSRAAVSVVDIHALHDTAQRFVVGSLLSEVFEAKQGSGREPIRFVVLDELNKYAPREGTSPIKELLVDIAERGRSLGVLLIGAQQAASSVDPAIIRNAAIKVVGRLDAGEAAEYRFLSPELRERASRFLPGTMVLDQPLVPAPLPLRFPFPSFATNPAEGARPDDEVDGAADDVFGKL
ncbi:MAG: ATP-binding protein [Acidimicrobiia bacterium]|nr:ATP-binding protein [Acidimicrobiia bacterium]